MGDALSGEIRPVLLFPALTTADVMTLGCELVDDNPVFWDWMIRCDGALGAHIPWSILDVVRGDTTIIMDARAHASVAFGVVVSLAQLWDSAGLTAGRYLTATVNRAAVGFCAGMLSLDDAADNAITTAADPHPDASWLEMAYGQQDRHLIGPPMVQDDVWLEISPISRTGIPGEGPAEVATPVRSALEEAAERLTLAGVALDRSLLRATLPKVRARGVDRQEGA